MLKFVDNFVDRYTTAVGGGTIEGIAILKDLSIRSSKFEQFLKLIMTSPCELTLSSRFSLIIKWTSRSVLTIELVRVCSNSVIECGT